MWGTKCKTKINQSRSTRNWLCKFVTGREREQKWCDGLLVTCGIGPEQVIHEYSWGRSFGSATIQVWFRQLKFLPLVVAVCRKCHAYKRGFWLAECRKGTKGTLFSMRCILSRKPRGFNIWSWHRKKKNPESREIKPTEKRSSDSLPQPQAWVYPLYLFPLEKLNTRTVLMEQVCRSAFKWSVRGERLFKME